jgi:hypothetical protein
MNLKKLGLALVIIAASVLVIGGIANYYTYQTESKNINGMTIVHNITPAKDAAVPLVLTAIALFAVGFAFIEYNRQTTQS